MQNVIRLSDTLQGDVDMIDGQPTLEVIDRGLDQGIDIRIYDPCTRDLVFEIIVLNPESCPLIGQSPQTSGSFRAFCQALSSIKASNCVLVQFWSDHVSKRGVCDSRDDRKSKLHMLAEDIADEVLTHGLGSVVDIVMH